VVCAPSGKAIAKTTPGNTIQLRPVKPLFIVYPADPKTFLKPGVVSSV
jgi:hypothetical protein